MAARGDTISASPVALSKRTLEFTPRIAAWLLVSCDDVETITTGLAIACGCDGEAARLAAGLGDGAEASGPFAAVVVVAGVVLPTRASAKSASPPLEAVESAAAPPPLHALRVAKTAGAIAIEKNLRQVRSRIVLYGISVRTRTSATKTRRVCLR
jgi:hypothetical protein